MNPILWFCRKRHERQAETARCQIAAAERLGLDLGPDIHLVLKDSQALAQKAWDAAQRWA